MNVLMLPHWPENPYQELLARHLESRGAHVTIGRRSDLWHPLRAARRGIDLVHLHSPAKLTRARLAPVSILRAVASLASLAALRSLRVPVVWTAHDLQDHDARRRLDHAFTWLLARCAAAVIVHGGRAQELLRARYGLPPRVRLPVVPHGPFDHYPRSESDREAFRAQLGIAPDQTAFLFLGAIRPYKGALELVRSFCQLESPDVRLLIRGRARDPRYETRLVREAARDPRIDVDPRFVPDEQVARFVHASDVVVAPYRAVLTSGSVILASSLGRPCIAPRMGTIPDALGDDSAFLYEPDAPDALLEALRRAREARERLPAMGRAARRRAQATSWDRVAELTLAVYQECLEAA